MPELHSSLQKLIGRLHPVRSGYSLELGESSESQLIEELPLSIEDLYQKYINRFSNDVYVDEDDIYEVDAVRNHLVRSYSTFERKWASYVVTGKAIQNCYSKAFQRVRDQIKKILGNYGLNASETQNDNLTHSFVNSYKLTNAILISLLDKAARLEPLTIERLQDEKTVYFNFHLGGRSPQQKCGMVNHLTDSEAITALNDFIERIRSDSELAKILEELKNHVNTYNEYYKELKGDLELYNKKLVFEGKCQFMGYRRDKLTGTSWTERC